MKKVALILIVAMVAGFLGWQVYRKMTAPRGGAAGAEAGTGARAAGRGGDRPVGRGTVREIAAFTGSLQPASRLLVAAKTGGLLERLLVDIGDRVASGVLIAVLDAREASRQVEQARAALTVAEANLEDARIAREAARREHERISTLREKKIASEAELEPAEDPLSKAESRHVLVRAQLQQQQTALESAREQVGDTRVTASWQGGGQRVVAERFVEPGALLRANDPIVSVLDVDRLIASVYVTEQAFTPGAGRPAGHDRSPIPCPAHPSPGQVVRVAPFLQESSRQAEVRIEVPNPGSRLKPGMFVRAELEFARRGENAVTVPPAAVVQREERKGVFLVDAESKRGARFVPVETGVTEVDKVEIVSPPLTGQVVVLGQHLLSDGSAVLLPRRAARQRRRRRLGRRWRPRTELHRARAGPAAARSARPARSRLRRRQPYGGR